MDVALVWSLVKHGVPALEAGWATAKPLIATEKDDVKAAIATLEKAFLDAKGAIPVIEAAIKAAAAS